VSETRPLVTIGISTYNRADGYLKEALASALAQSYPNLEIVVSDNCSSDGTEALVESFADPRIRYFRQEVNIGANNNFNFCLEQARGEYFLLLHDDDLIDPDFITACMDAAGHTTHAGLIRTGTRVIDAAGNVKSQRKNQPEGSTVADFVMSWFEKKTSLFLCSTLFHTQALKAIGGFQSPKNLYQDVVAEVKLVAERGWIDVSDVKASFRRHGDNAGSAARIGDWCDDSLYLLEVMCEAAPERAQEIRDTGMLYFCKQNYGRAARIPSRLERLKAYVVVYRKFHYVLSPFRHEYDKRAKRTKRFGTTVVRQLKG
jgi:glycosyltransferase involved in cell wall biosynthesis